VGLKSLVGLGSIVLRAAAETEKFDPRESNHEVELERGLLGNFIEEVCLGQNR